MSDSRQTQFWRLVAPLPASRNLILGYPGSGKSTLAAKLLLPRKYLLVLKSKPDKVRYQATVATKAVAMDDPRKSRLVLTPKYEHQRGEFYQALDKAWKQGGWTVYVDELFYLDDKLHLREPVDRLLTQGRSKYLSIFTGMQRPSLVTRFAISQATHVISFIAEGRDAKILGEATNRTVEQAVMALGEHQFVWFYRPQRKLWIGRYQDLQ